ncbi:YdcF family protein [Actinobacillus genomosp. 2]|uniref:SanA/YdcF family protein n=1 Tax=Actinobacillus genomosp. 2 TaxID=230709 RepID=UPI0024417884|nr:ElyC/SanA/YdcF family protein [Actinobacillus genomosp. 2]WGE32499.1 YdcF family protein [Actinobacillus genomosp. 2]
MELMQTTETAVYITPLWKRCVAFCFRTSLLFGWSIFIIGFLLVVIDCATGWYVKDRIYTDINKLPKHKYAMVLGTAKFYTKGVPNLYYKYRLDTAADLIKKGKVSQLLVSGDNKTPYYNEPKVMSNDLYRMGIPKSIVKQDFAGYRTLDSVVRAAKVYKIEPFIIISQQFHCERALFIAKYHNINAICFAAKYPEGHIKVRLRELLARIGMIWDFLIWTKPETFEDVKSK